MASGPKPPAGAPRRPGALERARHRVSPRAATDRLAWHLEASYGIEVARLQPLELGVFHVERTDGPDWVARLLPAERPVEEAVGDAEVLRFAAEVGFPAERCAVADPVTALDGQAVLVTEHVSALAGEARRQAVRWAGGVVELGDLLGRLHRLAGRPAGGRAGGAWHHLADGEPAAELAAASAVLAELADGASRGNRAAYRTLAEQLAGLDGGVGLPTAILHPDFVLANILAAHDGGLVVVDWTGAGTGPRMWTLAFLLFSEGAKHLRRVELVVAGYGRHVRPEPEELARLAALARGRPVVLECWKLLVGRQDVMTTERAVRRTLDLADAVGTRAVQAFGALEG